MGWGLPLGPGGAETRMLVWLWQVGQGRLQPLVASAVQPYNDLGVLICGRGWKAVSLETYFNQSVN